jgi:hypothetical protein
MAVPGLRIPISANMDDFERGMEKARDSSSRLLKTTVQQVAKFNDELSSAAAVAAGNWSRSWVNAAATMAGRIVVAVAAVKTAIAVIESVLEQMRDVVNVGDKASAAGVDPQFFQAWLAGSRNAKIGVNDLEDAIAHANAATKDMLNPDWSVWDRGLKKVTDVEKAMVETRELFRADQDFTGVDMFRNAKDNADRVRAALVYMTQLDAIGQHLASLDIGERMFGSKFVDNIRQGNISAKEMLDTVDSLRNGGDGVWSNELVEQTRAIDRELKQAYGTLSRELRPEWEGALTVANEIKHIWANIVELLAKAAYVFNQIDRFGGYLMNRLVPQVPDHVVANAPVASGYLGQVVGSAAPDAGAAIDRMKARTDYNDPLSIAAGIRDIGPPLDKRGQPAIPADRPSNAPKPQKEKEEAETKDAFETATDAINRNIASLQADTAAVGQSEAAHQQLRVELRLLEAARQAGVEITDQQIADYTSLRSVMSAEQALAATGVKLEDDQAAAFGRLSERIRTVTQALDDKRRAFQGTSEAVRYAGNELINVIDQATQKGANFGQIMSDVLRNFSKQLLQAALTGEGAFAKILGLAPTASGGVGGLLGALVGKGVGSAAVPTVGIAGSLAVPTFADGGVVPPNTLYMANEHSPGGPRIGRTGAAPMVITPNNVVPAGNSMSVSIGDFAIDARGATPGVGNEIVARLRSEMPGIAVAAVRQAIRYGKV